MQSHYDFAVGSCVISPGVNLKKNHYMPMNGHDPTQSIVHTIYLTRWVSLWNGLYAIPGYVQIHACQSGRFSSCVKLQNRLQLLNFSYPPMLHTRYIMCEFTTYMWTFTLGKCLRHILPSLSLGRGILALFIQYLVTHYETDCIPPLGHVILPSTFCLANC